MTAFVYIEVESDRAQQQKSYQEKTDDNCDKVVKTNFLNMIIFNNDY